MRDLTGILGLGISGLAAFELLKKQNKSIVVFDDNIKPNLKLKKYWKNYLNWDWNNLSRIIISPGIKISCKNKHPIVKFAENHKVKLQNEIELYFEQKGWEESTIVIRFWIIAVILALIGLSSLKLR